MTSQYYSTFPEGFSQLTNKLLLEYDKTSKVLNLGEKYIHFQSDLDINAVKNIPFLEVTLYLLTFFPKDKDYSFDSQIKWFKNNLKVVDQKLEEFEKGKRTSYRVVGTAPQLDNKAINKKVKELEEVMQMNKANPDFDIRFVEKDDHGYIGIRITKPAEYVDSFQRNSVRKEIAYFMVALSEPSESDIFLDPFCGGGIIPILRFKQTRFNSIYCNDIDTKFVREKVKELRADSINILEGDINTLPDRLSVKVNKIVTDPPWGFMTPLDDLKKSYSDMLSIFTQITTPEASIVLLTPHIDVIKDFIEENKSYELVEEFKGKVSGKDSYILKLRIKSL